MSDGAVLRGDDLVLRHDAKRRVVVPQAIGPWQESKHLAALDHARTRIGGVGPDGRGDRRLKSSASTACIM
jgi:hypothetical protein